MQVGSTTMYVVDLVWLRAWSKRCYFHGHPSYSLLYRTCSIFNSLVWPTAQRLAPLDPLGDFMYSCLYHQLLLCYQIQCLNCILFSVLVSLLRRKAAENELEKSDVPTTYFDV